MCSLPSGLHKAYRVMTDPGHSRLLVHRAQPSASSFNQPSTPRDNRATTHQSPNNSEIQLLQHNAPSESQTDIMPPRQRNREGTRWGPNETRPCDCGRYEGVTHPVSRAGWYSHNPPGSIGRLRAQGAVQPINPGTIPQLHPPQPPQVPTQAPASANTAANQHVETTVHQTEGNDDMALPHVDEAVYTAPTRRRPDDAARSDAPMSTIMEQISSHPGSGAIRSSNDRITRSRARQDAARPVPVPPRAPQGPPATNDDPARDSQEAHAGQGPSRGSQPAPQENQGQPHDSPTIRASKGSRGSQQSAPVNQEQPRGEQRPSRQSRPRATRPPRDAGVASEASRPIPEQVRPLNINWARRSATIEVFDSQPEGYSLAHYDASGGEDDEVFTERSDIIPVLSETDTDTETLPSGQSGQNRAARMARAGLYDHLGRVRGFIGGNPDSSDDSSSSSEDDWAGRRPTIDEMRAAGRRDEPTTEYDHKAYRYGDRHPLPLGIENQLRLWAVRNNGNISEISHEKYLRQMRIIGPDADIASSRVARTELENVTGVKPIM